MAHLFPSTYFLIVKSWISVTGQDERCCALTLILLLCFVRCVITLSSCISRCSRGVREGLKRPHRNDATLTEGLETNIDGWEKKLNRKMFKNKTELHLKMVKENITGFAYQVPKHGKTLVLRLSKFNV